MKIKKNFVSVFLLTFLIGYVSVLPTKKNESKLIEPSDSIKISETVSNTNPIPKMEDMEAIDEVNAWSEDVDYPDAVGYRFKIKLLETGERFHGEAVEAKNGEKWFGLFMENDEYYFRPTKLKIRRVFDEILDYPKKNKKTGKSVFVEGKNQPIFLLKDANKIPVGKIQTIFQGLSWYEAQNEEAELPIEDILTSLKRNFEKKFELNGKEYELKITDARSKENDRLWALILESQGVRQVLHTIKANENNDLGQLYWIGDLDQDGKPDFYFYLFEHYNVAYRVIFLSSKAEKGKLVKKVAYFWTTGC